MGSVVLPPWDELVLPVIVAYLAYIVWTRQDGRYPIVLALILLVASAVADAAGNLSAANTLAIFVFYLLAGGVIVLLIEHARAERTGSVASSPPSHPPEGVDDADPARTSASSDGCEDATSERAELG